MPTYNQEKYLKESVESVLNQTFKDWRLVIADDGSTDSTSEILKIFTDPRIEIYTKKNGGTGMALNFGFSKAKDEEYQTWWSSDSLMKPEFLEKMLDQNLDQKGEL